jgi:hypothetical protein
MVADGLSEDEALDVMILAWLNHERRGDFEWLKKDVITVNIIANQIIIVILLGMVVK